MDYTEIYQKYKEESIAGRYIALKHIEPILKNNNAEVIKYVKDNKSALGIISVNWISDTQDSISETFLKDIRIVEVGTDPKNYCKPYQGYIAEKSYPFRRDVYMISRETFSGLGTGFASFVAGDQGQRIILKSGLVPATMPIRLIEIKK